MRLYTFLLVLCVATLAVAYDTVPIAQSTPRLDMGGSRFVVDGLVGHTFVFCGGPSDLCHVLENTTLAGPPIDWANDFTIEHHGQVRFRITPDGEVYICNSVPLCSQPSVLAAPTSSPVDVQFEVSHSSSGAVFQVDSNGDTFVCGSKNLCDVFSDGPSFEVPVVESLSPTSAFEDATITFTGSFGSSDPGAGQVLCRFPGEDFVVGTWINPSTVTCVSPFCCGKEVVGVSIDGGMHWSDGNVGFLNGWWTDEEESQVFNCARYVGCECSDEADDDRDGKYDMHDPGCQHRFDKDEEDPLELPECSDGIDNDNDGLIDWPADPGCLGPGGVEVDRYGITQCNNGLDDDSDFKVDFLSDYNLGGGSPSCVSRNDRWEDAVPPGPAENFRLATQSDCRFVMVQFDTENMTDAHSGVSGFQKRRDGFYYETQTYLVPDSTQGTGFNQNFVQNSTYVLTINTVDNAGNLSPDGNAIVYDTPPCPPEPPTYNILIMPVYFQGDTWATDYTVAQMDNHTFNLDNPTSFNTYWTENSFGKSTFVGDVGEPYELPSPITHYCANSDGLGCSTSSIAADAYDGFTEWGVTSNTDLGPYDFVFILVQSMVGAYSAGFNKYFSVSGYMDGLRSQAHELAHGVKYRSNSHSGSIDCSSSTGQPFSASLWESLAGSCRISRYGDALTPLGAASGVRHMAAFTKWRMGYIPTNRQLTVDDQTEGEWDLYPLEYESPNAGDFMAFQVEFDQTKWPKHFLSVERRVMWGFDASPGAGKNAPVNGVVVRHVLASTTTSDIISYIPVQSTTSYYVLTDTSGPLIDHYRGISIEVTAMTDEYATVYVNRSIPISCPGAPADVERWCANDKPIEDGGGLFAENEPIDRSSRQELFGKKNELVVHVIARTSLEDHHVVDDIAMDVWSSDLSLDAKKRFDRRLVTAQPVDDGVYEVRVVLADLEHHEATALVRHMRRARPARRSVRDSWEAVTPMF